MLDADVGEFVKQKYLKKRFEIDIPLKINAKWTQWCQGVNRASNTPLKHCFPQRFCRGAIVVQ